MTVLIVKDYGVAVRLRRGLVLVCKGEEVLARVPLCHLERVIVVTSGVMVSSKLVRAASRAGVDLLFMDHRGEPVARLAPPYATRTVLTRRLQYEAYGDERGVEIAKAVAYSKVRNQAGMLRYIARNRSDPELRELLREVALEIDRVAEAIASIRARRVDLVRQEIINLEAEAAKWYWPMVARALPEGLGFTGRDQRGDDLFNKMLNYGYGILKGVAWRALVTVGLDPYAGYLHVDRSGRPSLVLDFMEQFRQPLVDRALLALVSREAPEPERCLERDGRLRSDFRARIAAEVLRRLSSRVRYDGGRVAMEVAVRRQARRLARYLRGEEDRYSGYIERW